MMNKYLILGALPVVLAGAGHGGHGRETTKTVYATSVHTVTSCAPTVTNCPVQHGKGPVVVTEVVPVSTTVCPVEDDDVVTSTRAPVGCSTSTAYSDCVHTITKTASAFVVTTTVPATTITKKVTSVSTSTCVHTLTGDNKWTVTTEFPTTVTKDVVETKYTDCVHTVTGATSLLVVTTAVPTTYTICPAKPTFPVHPEEPEWPVKPTGSWPAKPEEPEWPAKPTGVWPKPDAEVTGVSPVKPVGTGSWTKTVDGSKAVVTAGASAFGASGAIKMLGAAAAAALLL